MTVVELFDNSPINNVVSSLSMQPDKIIFLGSGKAMKRFDRLHREILRNRGISTEIECRSIPTNDLNRIVQELSRIVETEEQCVFDLTGGAELVLAAMGMVYEKYPEKKIGLQRVNVGNGTVTDCDGDGNVLYSVKPALSVPEVVRLHGGAVRFERGGEPRTYPWELNREFVADVHAVWDVSRQNPGNWNRLITMFGGICGSMEPELLDICIPLERLPRGDVEELDVLLDQLYGTGVILGYGISEEYLSFSFKDLQIRKLLEKAGTVLELKVLVTAAELLDENGDPFYSDLLSGVFLDWDGAFHEPGDEDQDTENEMDVILTRGLTPAFISCKNGKIEDEEIYKLCTVADRFGGKHAKRVLVATYVGRKDQAMESFRTRMKEMKIHLIEGVHKMSHGEFAQALEDIMKA